MAKELAPMLESEHHGFTWNKMFIVHLVDAVRTLMSFTITRLFVPRCCMRVIDFVSFVLECALLLVAFTVAIEPETLFKNCAMNYFCRLLEAFVLHLAAFRGKRH